MYDILNPAPNINVLYDFLKKEHKTSFCYRGQIKEYDFLTPSLYRNHIQKTPELLYGFLPINSSINVYDERRKLKLQEMRRLFKEFGASVGNILSQQYGLNSECLDITSDLKVAAFFATHDYPNYRLFRSDNNSLGIIYRIKTDMLSNEVEYAGIELMKSALHVIPDYIPYNNYPILFTHKREILTDEQLILLKTYEPFEMVKAITYPLVLSFQQIRHVIETYVEENNKNHFLLEYMETTRLFKQSGGLILPSIMYDASIPRNTTPRFYEPLNRFINSPGIAIMEKMIGIEDIAEYSFVEKFYFVHGSELENEIDIEPSELWPSVDTDYYFYLIAHMIVLACADYLEKNDIFYDDPKLGILDRGYY